MAISRLHPVAFGAVLGVLFGVSVLVMGLSAHFLLHDKPIAMQMGAMYLTYIPSPINSAFCAVIAGVNGFIGGYIFSRGYNLLIGIL